MNDLELYTLVIDADFRSLKCPLSPKEYSRLDASIQATGCNEPILVWGKIIIDGHYRYKICHKHRIPFQVVQADFECREATMAWICSQQIERGNLTEEYRKYLIGMEFGYEKILSKKRHPSSNSLYDGSNANDSTQEEFLSLAHSAALRLASKYHISRNTVSKYHSYARAIEGIRRKAPDVVPKILAGTYKISHNNILEMANFTTAQIMTMISRVDAMKQPFVQYKDTRQEIENIFRKGIPMQLAPGPTIKEMPQYDPDAEIVSLSLTIPSWVNTINRSREHAAFCAASQNAKQQLYSSLGSLIECAQKLQQIIKETADG